MKRRLNRRTKVVLYTCLIALVVAGAFIAGAAIPDSAVAADFTSTRQPPSWSHPFGTDALGRDLLARTLKGLSISLTVGTVASLISAVVAVLVGIAAAVGSPRVDAAVNWCIDLVMGVPHTVLIILISFALGRGLWGLLVGIAATHWTSLARLIRGEVMQLRSQQYIAVSRKLGKSSGWILTHHLLPHLVPQFIVGLILMFPHAILHEASISFLGYGLPPEQPAIGIILSESMQYLSTGMWWPAVFPGAVLVGIVLLVDRLGENLRMILDPYSAQGGPGPVRVLPHVRRFPGAAAAGGHLQPEHDGVPWGNPGHRRLLRVRQEPAGLRHPGHPPRQRLHRRRDVL